MNNQALPRSHSFKLLGVSITENMIWHEHVSSIATAAGKKLGYLFRARKYFPPSNLLTLYKAQIRPSLEYCSHIWGAAAPTTLSILDAVQRRAIRLIGDPALTCHLQPLSHRHATATIRRRVLASELRCRRPLRVPLLTARHRTARLQWARAHQDWLLPQWKNVLFLDDSRFVLVSDDYRERVWRERGGQNRLATAIGAAP
nr:unnamed protein product [Callosobruchus chinensis]